MQQLCDDWHSQLRFRESAVIRDQRHLCRKKSHLVGRDFEREASGSTSARARGARNCRQVCVGLRQRIFLRCEHEDSPDIDVERLRGNAYVNRYKRAVDLTVGLSLMLVTLPAWFLIAIAIKLDSAGPVFFAQDRTGHLGQRFRMYKFRTMSPDAEARKLELLHMNMHDADSPDFKIQEDPRVTRVGRILRRTSLDELPNLINVVKGDMSLVGPRPTSFHASTYRTHHLSRLAIKPGITGIWQVSGRANVDFDERTVLDVHYINRASLLLDLQLLVRTLFRAWNGAY